MTSKVDRRYFIKSFSWGFASKIVDAICKFFSVPILISAFGKSDYALISLAIAINAYLSLLDMGTTTGGIKFYAQLFEAGDSKRLSRLFQSSLTFYISIGALNAAILFSSAPFCDKIFNISQEQHHSLATLLTIVGTFSISNWIFSALNQLIAAANKIFLTHRIDTIKNIANFALAIVAKHYHISIGTYFFAFSCINTLAIIPSGILIIKYKLSESIIPSWDWEIFKPVFKYSLGLTALSGIQMTATYSRPLILGIFSRTGISIITEYRVLETICTFTLSLGAVISSTFLPSAARLVAKNNSKETADFIESATYYTTIIVVAITSPFIINARSLIYLYVGSAYIHTSAWLVVWLTTILLLLHSAPASAVLVSKGNTKPLIATTAVSCCISVAANALLCSRLGAGSAVLGFAIYVTIQMAWYYGRFYRSLIKIPPLNTLKSFLVPSIFGAILVLIFQVFPQYDTWPSVILRTFTWAIFYAGCLWLIHRYYKPITLTRL